MVPSSTSAATTEAGLAKLRPANPRLAKVLGMIEASEVVGLDLETTGLDPRSKLDVQTFIEEIRTSHDASIVLTTHDLNGLAAHLPHLVCLNTVVVDQGSPRHVLTADTLERTFGAPMQILEHAGMPIVLDRFSHAHGNVIPMREKSAS